MKQLSLHTTSNNCAMVVQSLTDDYCQALNSKVEVVYLTLDDKELVISSNENGNGFLITYIGNLSVRNQDQLEITSRKISKK